jgi:hypothetical protein
MIGFHARVVQFVADPRGIAAIVASAKTAGSQQVRRNLKFVEEQNLPDRSSAAEMATR